MEIIWKKAEDSVTANSNIVSSGIPYTTMFKDSTLKPLTKKLDKRITILTFNADTTLAPIPVVCSEFITNEYRAGNITMAQILALNVLVTKNPENGELSYWLSEETTGSYAVNDLKKPVEKYKVVPIYEDLI